MTTEEKLKVAVEALEKIAYNDCGPAYYIAKDALVNVEETFDAEENKRKVADAAKRGYHS